MLGKIPPIYFNQITKVPRHDIEVRRYTAGRVGVEELSHVTNEDRILDYSFGAHCVTVLEVAQWILIVDIVSDARCICLRHKF